MHRAVTALALPVAVLALTQAPALASAALPDRLVAVPAATKKPKPVTCKPAQTRVTAGGRTRCITLPKPKADGDPRLSLLRELVRRDPGTLRARRGKRIKPLWSTAGGRLKRVRARLLRALPRALAFADAQRAKASTAVNGDRNCRSGLQQESASFDGFSFSSSANGDVTMNVSAGSGYAIEVLIGGAVRCSDLDLPACPMPDGALDGKDGRGNALGFRVTKDGALVQSLRTVVRSKQTMKGKVAVDAKLDDMTLEDIANETTTFRTPDANVTLRVSVRRFVTIDMRIGLPRGAPQIQVGVGGLVGADARAQADKVRRAYEQSFPDLMSEEIQAYRRRETLWQRPGECAKVVSPVSDSIKVPRLVQGTVQPHVEANAGGTAARAKWTLSAQEHGTFSPDAVEAPSPSISFTPTGQDRQKLKAKFRATSTAGVAEGPWSQEIEDRVRYFKVTGMEYTDQLALDGMPSVGSCTPSTSQTNTTTLMPSGQPYDGAVGTIAADGPLRGSLTATGSVLSTASFSGCQLNDDGTDWLACHQMGSGSLPMAFLLDIELAPPGPATLTWHPLPPHVGNVPPVISPCVVFGGQSTLIDAATSSAPADAFTSAGTHTVAVDAPRDVPAVGAGTLHSTAHYSFTFVRVNADGSPYTG